jgi:hypothetical protein
MKSIVYKALTAVLFYFFFGLFTTNTLVLQSCGDKIPPIDTIIKKDSLVDTSAIRIFNFQPITIGSEWKFVYKHPLTGDTIHYTLTCTNRDTTLQDSKIYRVFDGTQNTKEYHMVQDTWNYWTTIPGSSTIRPLLILKSNAQENETWVGAINGNDTYYQTLVSKNIIYKVDNTTYKNVMVVNQKRITGGQTTLNATIYIAEGIGIVYSIGVGELKLIYANIK